MRNLKFKIYNVKEGAKINHGLARLGRIYWIFA
jgi:hypothetical protein